MVKGLDTFRKYSEQYEDQYVLIGGAACDIDSFIELLEHEPFDANSLKYYGLGNQDVVDTLRRVFD